MMLHHTRGNMLKRIGKFLVAWLAAGLVLPCVAYAEDQLSTPTANQRNTLRAYAEMNKKEQLVLIFETRKKILSRIGRSNPERTLCLTSLFADNDQGDKQWVKIKGILNIAVERQLLRSVQYVVERVITREFCPDHSASEKK
jgi:hypothetical protein